MEKIKKFFEFLNKSAFIGIEDKIIALFKQFPKLPTSIVDLLISIGPYLALIGGIISVLSIFSWGLPLYFAGAVFGINLFRLYLYRIVAVISGIMLIVSFNDLKNLKIFGFRIIFWSVNLSIIVSLVTFDLLGAFVNALISWYLLSQIRNKYN